MKPINLNSAGVQELERLELKRGNFEKGENDGADSEQAGLQNLVNNAKHINQVVEGFSEAQEQQSAALNKVFGKYTTFEGVLKEAGAALQDLKKKTASDQRYRNVGSLCILSRDEEKLASNHYL